MPKPVEGTVSAVRRRTIGPTPRHVVTIAGHEAIEGHARRLVRSYWTVGGLEPGEILGKRVRLHFTMARVSRIEVIE